MTYTFNIDLTGKSIPDTLATVKTQILSNGGTFTGTDQSGSFSGDGVTGEYTVLGTKVAITIMSQPWYATNSAVQSAIEKYFNS